MTGYTYTVATVEPVAGRWLVQRFTRDGYLARCSFHRTERGALQAVNNWSKFLANNP